MGGAADVAIVEADHVQLARGELFAEVVLPGDHLCAQPHDQQHRRIGGVAKGLVAEGYPTADVAEELRHDRWTVASRREALRARAGIPCVSRRDFPVSRYRAPLGS